jgi:CSLREA domain-containing protein
VASEENGNIYEHGQLDSRPFTDADKPALIARRTAASHAPILTGEQQIEVVERDKWQPDAKESWSDVQQIVAIPGGGNLSAQALVTGSHTTGRRTDDLFVLDTQSQQVHLFVDTSTVSEPWNPRVPVSLDVDGSPLAIMAMPQKINASRDLVVLSSAHTDAGTIGLAPETTFTVTQLADRNSTCGTGGQCSLREAINSANNTAGTNTVNFSVNGTFTNTLGAFPTQGDVNSNNITILGSSPANTVIANTGSGANHSVLYYGFVQNQTFKLQNLTIQNGNTADGFGGGAFAMGEPGEILTVDNCVVTNNISQSTDNGGAISQSGGGSVVIQNNTIISNNTATAAIGGGIAVNNSTNVGGLTITDSSFTGNTATTGVGAGQGGGIWIGVESSGGSVVTITRATITDNTAQTPIGQGGGIYTNKATITFSRIVGNTASAAGSGVFEPGGGFAVTANNNWWGCNTGPGGAATGGCMAVPNNT